MPVVGGMHQINAPIFGALASELVRLGWSVFPQTRDDRRGPGKVDNMPLRWKEFSTRLPTQKEVEWWGSFCPSHNVACILGTASGEVFGVDVDVSDVALSEAIQELADRILGYTPFRRVGRFPRIVLLYRQLPEAEQDPAHRIPSRSWKFVQQDEKGSVGKSDDGIEILSRGKPVTFFGLHHKTGKYFIWLDKSPHVYGPEHAPLVDHEKVLTFLEEVQKLRRFHRNSMAVADDTSWVYDASAGLNVPRLFRNAGSEWTEDEATGKVVDGREQFLFRLAYKTVKANESAARDTTGAGLHKLRVQVSELFKERAELSGKWDESYLREQVREKVSRAVRDTLSSGRFDRDPVAAGRRSEAPARPRAEPVADAPAGAADDLDYIQNGGPSLAGSFSRRLARRKVDATFTDPDEARRLERALIPDRREIAVEVQVRITAGLDTFFGEVYSGERGNNVHVLKAPTGAGKTSRSIAYVATDPRTKQYDDIDDDAVAEDDAEGASAPRYPGPLVFLLPTYHNIEELRNRAEVLNLDPALSDRELAVQARERGLIQENEMESRVADLRRDASNAGLRTLLYRGKGRAGCKVQDKLDMLMAAGIGTAGLCKAKVKGEGEDAEFEERLCEFYDKCPAILQRKEIRQAHVVFMPHAFLTLAVPEELQRVRGVVADERIFHLFLHTTTFRLDTLRRERRPPKVSKKEAEQGATGEDFLADRNLAADIAYHALQAGRCPAQSLADYREGKLNGLDLVRSAKRVCSHAIAASQAIVPGMPLDDIKSICDSPTGTEVREEARFWSIVQERIEALRPEYIRSGLVAAAVANGHPEAAEKFPALASGDRDYRIQLLKEETREGERAEKVRISWRTKPNWESAPLLLLDASADPSITGKIFSGRKVVVHDVPAPLNVRTVAVVDSTYSNAAIVRRGKPREADRLQAARTKDKLRKLISGVSSLYGFGRVVIGANVIVRRAIGEKWSPPSNVDWCHYGAMRGLDFAKYHAAALSFGRMEVPVRSIDGLVAALTYDDPEPEEPFDRNGDGIDAESGESLRVPMGDQVMQMRSGADVTVQVPTYPGRWAKIVQKQYREEELRQFLGRLRPVYREGEAPTWIAVSRVLPDEIVVDDVINLDDLVSSKLFTMRLWDACRLSGGVMHAGLLPLAAPMLYAGEGDAAADMAKIKLDQAAGALDPGNRLAWGFTPVRIERPGQPADHCFVRTDLEDPAGVARAAFARYLGWGEGEAAFTALPPCKARKVGSRREPDFIEQELGTREDRLEEETAIKRQCAEEAIAGLSHAAFETYAGVREVVMPVRINVPVIGSAIDMPLTIDEMAADKTTEMVHVRLLTGHCDAALSPVIEPAETYDNLSDLGDDVG